MENIFKKYIQVSVDETDFEIQIVKNQRGLTIDVTIEQMCGKMHFVNISCNSQNTTRW